MKKNKSPARRPLSGILTIVHIPAEVAIATPAIWYLYKKPVQQIPQVFRDAFRDANEEE